MKNSLIICAAIILKLGFVSSQWIAQDPGTGTSINTVDFINANTGWAAGDNSKVYRTTNGGTNWNIITIPGNPVNITHSVAKDFAYLAGTRSGSIFGTTNNGANWYSAFLGAHVSLGDLEEQGGNLYAAVYQLNNAEDTILSAKIMRSTNNGINWVQITSIAMNVSEVQPNGMPNRISMNFRSNDTGYIATVKGMYITVNGGQTYSAMSNTPCCPHVLETSGTINQAEKLYAGIKQPGKLEIYKSINSGSTWTLSSVIPDPADTKLFTGIECPSNSDKIYLIIGNISAGLNSVQDTSVYYSSNGGLNWQYQTLPVNNIQIHSIDFIDENTGYIAGSNGTILKTTNGGVIGIQQTSNEIPKTYVLHQNYPNPFNPVTNIRFDIASGGNVKLIVYDTGGKKITILVNGELGPGSYTADWNASEYPSGIYFCKLETEGFTQTKKMILIK